MKTVEMGSEARANEEVVQEAAETNAKPEIQVVRVLGRLDITTAERVRTQLLAASGNNIERVVLDLAEIADLDVAGLQLVCSANQTFAAQGIGFEVRGLRPEMLKLAADCGFLHESTLMSSLYAAAQPGSLSAESLWIR